MAAVSSAVDTRTSLETLPRPIAAVRAVSVPFARAGEGRRCRVLLRIAAQRRARRLPLSPHHLTSYLSRAPRASPPSGSSGTPVSRFLSIAWCGVRRLGAARERLTERDSHAIGHTRLTEDGSPSGRSYIRLVSRVATTSCVVLDAIERKEDRRVSRSVSFYRGVRGEEVACTSWARAADRGRETGGARSAIVLSSCRRYNRALSVSQPECSVCRLIPGEPARGTRNTCAAARRRLTAVGATVIVIVIFILIVIISIIIGVPKVNEAGKDRQKIAQFLAERSGAERDARLCR